MCSLDNQTDSRTEGQADRNRNIKYWYFYLCKFITSIWKYYFNINNPNCTYNVHCTVYSDRIMYVILNYLKHFIFHFISGMFVLFLDIFLQNPYGLWFYFLPLKRLYISNYRSYIFRSHQLKTLIMCIKTQIPKLQKGQNILNLHHPLGGKHTKTNILLKTETSF